jgi:hypothetical protein
MRAERIAETLLVGAERKIADVKTISHFYFS